MTVNWGDGITEQFFFPYPSSFNRPHTYADDGLYTITVTVVDGAGGVGVDTTTAQIGTIASVEWVAKSASPLDANPNPGGGKRIFPDKIMPNENAQTAASRREVTVRVTLTQAAPNQTVYINVWDVDDPSSNRAPVDLDGVGGDALENLDNRGITGNSYIVTTNTNISEVTFVVSMQPGDNYRATATCHQPAIATLYARQNDGTAARMFDWGPDGLPYTADDFSMPTDKVKVTQDLLTVWRRLHVEVDSMGEVEDNTLTGFIFTVSSDPARPGVSILTATTGETLGAPGDVNRFSPGQLTDSSGQTYTVTGNSSTSPAGVFTIDVLNGEFFPPSLGAFSMVDDDGLQDGQDVPMPNTSTLEDGMKEAFVKVLFDAGNENENNVPFIRNIGSTEDAWQQIIQNHWFTGRYNSENYWVAYILAVQRGFR